MIRKTKFRTGTLCFSLVFVSLAGPGCGGDGDDEKMDLGVMDSGEMGSPDTGVPPDMGVEPECTTNSECSGATPYCNEAQECAAPPLGGAIGWGDGAIDSVDVEMVFTPQGNRQTTDLEFNPARPNELWVLHREFASTDSCTQDAPTQRGCGALEGSTSIVFNVGEPEMTAEWKRDGNAWHFMRRPPALAFGVDGLFATCGEERTGNFLDGVPTFIGPSLWSSDPAIYAITPPGGNGSHLDMLHESPFCTGIAHEAANIYWVINGEVGAFDRYNFNEDHGPGADDHSDGEVYRYAVGEYTRVPDVPSHMAYNPDDQHLYVADTGGARIIKLDTTSGTMVGPISPIWEPLQANGLYEGAVVTEVVPPGTLDRPSGLELHDGLLYVTDNAQSRFYVFDLEGNQIRTLNTNLPEGALAGMALSPEGAMYFGRLDTSDIYRITPK